MIPLSVSLPHLQVEEIWTGSFVRLQLGSWSAVKQHSKAECSVQSYAHDALRTLHLAGSRGLNEKHLVQV